MKVVINSDLINDIRLYCWRFQKKAHREGKSYIYRTYREIKKRFRIKYFHIDRIIETDPNLVLITNVMGNDAPIRRGDYMVECVKPPKKV